MTVTIDIGNSAVKIATVSEGRVGAVLHLPTAEPPPVHELAARIAEAAHADTPGQLLAMVSVVPRWAELVAHAATALGLRLLTLDATTIPLPNRLPDPERVGADRLLAAWTAVTDHGAPVVVVDMGTATTIDGVDASGAFAGGAIMPGPALSVRALAMGAAQLPPVPVEAPDHALGRDTVEAIQSGVVLGHILAVSGLIRRASAEVALAGRPRPIVVMTGGFAQARWARAIEGVDVRDPELLLRGMGMLADANSVSHGISR